MIFLEEEAAGRDAENTWVSRDEARELSSAEPRARGGCSGSPGSGGQHPPGFFYSTRGAEAELTSERIFPLMLLSSSLPFLQRQIVHR